MKQKRTSFAPVSARKRLSTWLGASAVAACLLSSGAARAQADLTPPPPNLLLLVDTSGSMDYKSGSNSFPSCKYVGTSSTSATSERSRWVDLIEVLTGSVEEYECQRLDRSSTDFKTEYAISAQNPYDFLYPNPFIRPVNKDCVNGPGDWLSTNPAAYNGATSIKSHRYSNTTIGCTFAQKPDGVMDAFQSDVRFGLMTFDTEPRGGTDVSGLWSYYVSSGPVQGKPEGCPTLQDQEVGVRNASAPPWEGRAVGFGNPVADTAQLLARNQMIQNILRATRPYGATPIAGMLSDARDFFLNDTANDPLDSSFKFGPKDDKATCRRKAAILLSDGQPNMDLRPFCEPAGCPYSKAEDIAADMKAKGIDVYVIGFGLSSFTVNGTPRTCKDIQGADLTTGLCKNATDPNLSACCALNRIAAAGGHAPVDALDADWRYAHFADDREGLRRAISDAIGANFPATSRTPSVQASGSAYLLPGADLDFARGFRFAAAFEPGTAGQGWVGKLTRSRYQCETVSGVQVPVLKQPDASKGDDFVANVNKGGPDARVIYTALGTSKLDGTLRPNINPIDNEGVGTNSATMGKYTSSSFVTSVSADNMQLTDSSCDSAGVSITKDACRDRVLKWLVGLSNGTVYHRCPNPGADTCNLVGDIVRSAPRAVAGRPSALISDSSYDAFVTEQETNQRPSVLYASSNDGFLHAFKMAPLSTDENETMSTKKLESNELWTFVPPAVLPALRSSYPGAHQTLLDGSPAIKDVVATDAPSATGYKFKLERTQTDAQAGIGKWRTILVQSFGKERAGYFAIDITDPVPGVGKGPQFLWQLVNDETSPNPNQLFGSGGGTPLITTVFVGGDEVAVAILPGGYGGAATPGTCTRGTDVTTGYASGYAPRPNVRCYTEPSSVLARSLTVVRLDTGKVLRTFRRNPNEVPKLRDGLVVTTTPLDSPMTGQPVAFPSEVGALADRVFIGDQDGALWRLTLAGQPADWKMDLFFDTFPGEGTFSHTAEQGQPIITPPILSIDQSGNLVVAVSTGDQEALASSAATTNYVWSLSESSDRTKLNAVPNWHLDFKGTDAGYRVIGNMALFAGTLYFSVMNRPDDGKGACSQGVGRVYGMHYLQPEESKTAGKGGKVDKNFVGATSPVPYIPSSDITGGAGEAFLGGVSIGQQPTCETLGTPSEDEYFKYGVHYALGAPTAGKFQLFISTGSTVPQPTRSGITAVNQGGAQAAAVNLESPPVTTRVDSWAAIVE
jgi:type IV pilus assembly protein PilY1